MPLSESDPRVFFAAERTLLAWVRTGITIIAIGLVVSRFGLFMQFVLRGSDTLGPPGTSVDYSAILGMTFVLVGSISILLAAIQHKRYLATLSPIDLPPAYSRSFSLVLALIVATLGIALAGYLFTTHPEGPASTANVADGRPCEIGSSRKPLIRQSRTAQDSGTSVKLRPLGQMLRITPSFSPSPRG